MAAASRAMLAAVAALLLAAGGAVVEEVRCSIGAGTGTPACLEEQVEEAEAGLMASMEATLLQLDVAQVKKAADAHQLQPEDSRPLQQTGAASDAAMAQTPVNSAAVNGTVMAQTAVNGSAVNGTAMALTAVNGSAVNGTAMALTAVNGTAAAQPAADGLAAAQPASPSKGMHSPAQQHSADLATRAAGHAGNHGAAAARRKAAARPAGHLEASAHAHAHAQAQAHAQAAAGTAAPRSHVRVIGHVVPSPMEPGQVLMTIHPADTRHQGSAVLNALYQLGSSVFSSEATKHSRSGHELAQRTDDPGEVAVAGHSKVRQHHKLKSDSDFMQALIPVSALILGSLLLLCGIKTPGLLAVYFGAQSGFSLYMKAVLSNAEVSQELKMKGIPAAFLVTAFQQVVAFVLLALVLLVLWVTPCRYTPKVLKTPQEWAGILTFSAAFAVNIGFNNFSLSLLAVSMNLIIRSCLPLVTLCLQLVLGQTSNVKLIEVFFMVAGVIFAALATVAKGAGSHGSSESHHLILGVVMCSLSDIAAALNLVLASMWTPKGEGSSEGSGGEHGRGGMKLNPVDTTLYMALPAAAFLSPAAFLMEHPTEWPGAGNATMTDWGVLMKVWELSPSTMNLVVLSGLFAAAYNLLQYALVQSLSATHAAFAGNFNKAATIMLSICLGLEHLPSGVWAFVMLGATLGNIASFTGYSIVKATEAKPTEPPALKEKTVG